MTYLPRSIRAPIKFSLNKPRARSQKDVAQRKDAQVNLERYKLLFKEGVIPKQQLDTQDSSVGEFDGAIQTDQATIDNAKLNLVYCRITAPISGRVGLRLVDPGNMIHATDANGLVVITQLQPIAVLFSLPQDQLPVVYTKLRAGQQLTVEAFDRDNTAKIAEGKLLTIDNQIDSTTGTYKLKAVFNNTDNTLFPNQFVNVHLLVNTLKNVVLVPTTAILRGSQGIYVYSVSSDKTVKVRSVVISEANGNITGISSGLNPGDVVVTDGQDKLQDGSKVDPRTASASTGSSNLNSSNSANSPFAGAPLFRWRPGSMNPSRPFILRPVATTLLMVGVLLVGYVAYRQLPVSALPQVDYPTIQVQTFYPGASPDVMASSVTAPLERNFGQIPGLLQMTSTSSFGSSLITLQFNLDLNIDIAEQEVQAEINGASNLLPKDLPNPPIYSKVNPADSPVLTLALTSQTLPLSKIEDLADTTLAQKISQLSGVGLVSISGGQRPAVRVQANPTALASYGLSLEDLRNALAAANVDQAKGTFDGVHQGLHHRRQRSVAYQRRLPLHHHRVSQWRARAPLGYCYCCRRRGKCSSSGLGQQATRCHPKYSASARRQHHQRRRSREETSPRNCRPRFPASIQVKILTDRTTTIRASVEDVQFTLLLTIALVVMVIFVFLRSVRATVIPSVAVPLSIVGTFAVMYALGYSLNNLSLMALTISTGLRGR